MLDPFTFGSSLASVLLARELDKLENGYVKKKISTHLKEFNEVLAELSTIKSKRTKTRMARLWMLECVNHSLKIKSQPGFNLDSTMKNVIMYRYRLWLDKQGILRKQESANRKIKNEREEKKARLLAEESYA